MGLLYISVQTILSCFNTMNTQTYAQITKCTPVNSDMSDVESDASTSSKGKCFLAFKTSHAPYTGPKKTWAFDFSGNTWDCEMCGFENKTAERCCFKCGGIRM